MSKPQTESNSLKTVAGGKVEKALDIALRDGVSLEKAVKETGAEIGKIEPKDLNDKIKKILAEYNIHDDLIKQTLRAKLLEIMVESEDDTISITAAKELAKVVGLDQGKQRTAIFSENVQLLLQEIKEEKRGDNE